MKKKNKEKNVKMKLGKKEKKKNIENEEKN